jgi:hypothetical protein
MVETLWWISVFGGPVIFAAAVFWGLSYRRRRGRWLTEDQDISRHRPRQL